jgi:regulator of sigma E protease
VLNFLGGIPFTIVVAVFVLGVLIFVHELGHFLVAKAVGVGVPRFSLGLGPVSPIRWKWGETEYVISWVPFGGYVKMATAEDEEQGMIGALEGGNSGEGYPPEKLFESKPLWARIAVIVAGVSMNALFAWFIYSALAFTYGSVEDATTRVATVDSAGLPPAAMPLTGVPIGSTLLRVNGDTIRSWTDLMRATVDPRSSSLRFQFAGQPAIDVAIPGTDLEARAALAARIVPFQPPVVGTVSPGTPAARAGVHPDDEIVRFDGDTVRHWAELVGAIEQRAGDSITLTVLRGGTLQTLGMVPDSVLKEGRTQKVGQIGVSRRVPLIRAQYGFFGAIRKGGHDTALAVTQVWAAVKGFVMRRISPRNLGGVLQIGQMSGQFARQGFDVLLGLMAFLSVNLAVLNLLPIPVLDGGHLMFLLAEGVKGKPLSLKVRLRLSQAGLVFLIGLMLFALSNDVMRILGK